MLHFCFINAFVEFEAGTSIFYFKVYNQYLFLVGEYWACFMILHIWKVCISIYHRKGEIHCSLQRFYLDEMKCQMFMSIYSYS